MHRAVLLAAGPRDRGRRHRLLDGAVRTPAGAAPPAGAARPTSGARALVGRTVADVERDLILDTLRHCLGNRTHAANILGISIRTLRNKLKQYSDEGIAVPVASVRPGASLASV